MRTVLALAASLALAVPAVASAAAARSAPARLPDWSGVWNPAERNIFDPAAFSLPENQGLDSAAYMRERPPYNAEWEAKYVKKLADNRAGLPTDPTASCRPGGMPRIMTSIG